MFFILAQTEQGDIFKITLETSKEEDLVSLEIKIIGHIGWDVIKTMFSGAVYVVIMVIVQVSEIRLKYFDTVPVASAMCVLRTGFLFVASEFGNQYVFGLLLHLHSAFHYHFVAVHFIRLLILVMMMMKWSSLVQWLWRKEKHFTLLHVV